MIASRAMRRARRSPLWPRATARLAALLAGLAARLAGLATPLAAPALAAAQADPPAQAARPATPDTVRLRNGGLVRGTIVELEPGVHVTVLLPNGELRRIPAAEVLEPSDDASRGPSAPPPDAGVRADRESAPEERVGARAGDPPLREGAARVRLRAERSEGLTFYGALGDEPLRALCETPCSPTLPVGNYRLALARPGSPQVAVPGRYGLEDGDVLEGRYHARGGTRAAGWVVLGVSLAAGLGVALAPLFADARTRDGLWLPAIVGGVVLGGLGALVGALLTGAEDEARVDHRHRPQRETD
jgi:hypothetical protein